MASHQFDLTSQQSQRDPIPTFQQKRDVGRFCVCIGIHVCLGLKLAKVEVEISLERLAQVHCGKRQGNRNAVVHHSPGLADRREAYPGNHTSEHQRSSPIASIERQSAETAINPRSVLRSLCKTWSTA